VHHFIVDGNARAGWKTLTFLVCGALSPSFLDVSILDFLGVGFYMGSFAWVLLLVK